MRNATCETEQFKIIWWWQLVGWRWHDDVSSGNRSADGPCCVVLFFLRSVNGFPLLCLVHTHTHTYTFSPLKTVHNNQGRAQHRGTHTRGTVSFLPMMPRRGFPIVCALLCVLFFPVNHTLHTRTYTHSLTVGFGRKIAPFTERGANGMKDTSKRDRGRWRKDAIAFFFRLIFTFPSLDTHTPLIKHARTFR